VLDLTGSKADLGYVLAAYTAPLVLFLLVGGIWADRLPRHHVMVASNLVSGASQAAVPLRSCAHLAARRHRSGERHERCVLLSGDDRDRPADRP
jgi:MFS family permease